MGCVCRGPLGRPVTDFRRRYDRGSELKLSASGKFEGYREQKYLPGMNKGVEKQRKGPASSHDVGGWAEWGIGRAFNAAFEAEAGETRRAARDPVQSRALLTHLVFGSTTTAYSSQSYR